MDRTDARDAGSALLASAWQSYDRGDLDAAIAAGSQARALLPRWAEPATALGWFLMESGDGNGAETALADALAIAPDHATAHWYLGTMHHRRGRAAQAETELRLALRLDPRLDEARVTLAWLLHDRGHLDEALELSRTAVGSGEHPHRLVQLGWLLLQTDQGDAAVETLRRAVAAAPADCGARAKLAIALSRTGREGEAEATLREGLLHGPSDRELLVQLGWHRHRQGDHEEMKRIALALTESDAADPDGWHLRALAHPAPEDQQEAARCFAQAEALAPHRVEILLDRAALLRRLGQVEDAAWLLESVLAIQPNQFEAALQLAQLRLDQDRPADARQLVRPLLGADPRNGDLWRILADALHGLGRRSAARACIRRAARLAPTSDASLALAGWLYYEAARFSKAAEFVEQRIGLSPDKVEALVQGALIADAMGDLASAERWAEKAVIHGPGALAWRSLARVRRSQRRWEEAEYCLHAALTLEPSRRDLLIDLAWTLVGADRLAEAEIASLAATDAAPEVAETWTVLAQIRLLAGRADAALEAADSACVLAEEDEAARRVRARCLAALALAGPPERRAALHAEATALVAGLLQDRKFAPDTMLDALRLAAIAGGAARALPALLPPEMVQPLLRQGIEHAVAHAGAAEVMDWIDLARSLGPVDPWFEAAGLYAEGMAGRPSEDHSPRIRLFARALAAKVGTALPPRPPLYPPPPRKLRIAYLASHLHEPLLLPVLAAHDESAVEIFLYTPQPEQVAGRLGGAVRLHDLQGAGLAESLQANAVNAVIDTVGLHPFHGQYEVLKALCRRVAPVQCGWLGNWGTGGGLYDALFLDANALSSEASDLFEEEILAIPGGAWAWSPPLSGCDPGPPPLLATGRPTFAATVRGFRMSQATLHVWADLLAAIPTARLEILGTQSRDWRLRSEFAEICRSRDVDPARVGYQYQRDHAAHLAFFRDVDVCLDAFPGNGGLSSLDALWMGVPVVTADLSDEYRSPISQGAALAHAIGRPEWIARSREDYVAIAERLAGDGEALAACRSELRGRMAASPLGDPRRVARHIENEVRRLVAAAADIIAAPDEKSVARAVARRDLLAWLPRGRGLAMPHAAAPEVSVIIVTYGQAGLTRHMLASLSDQRDVAFETILVDNGSSDETSDLLDRVTGARIVRNADNRGFLAAANQGAALARGRYILFVNNDTILQHGAITAALRRIETDPAIGIVGGRIILANGRLQEAGCIAFPDGSTVGYGRGRDPDDPEFRFGRDVDFCSGAFLLVRSDLWRRLGGFDPGYAPAYYEDTDLCFRAWAAGFRVVYEPDAVLTHLEWASSGKGEATEAMRRNRLAFLERHQHALPPRAVARSPELLVERWRRHEGDRILILDNAVPHEARGAGLPRARQVLQALEGRAVTLFPLWEFEDDWRSVHASVPSSTEIMLGWGRGRLERFLESRQGVYQVILVSRPDNMRLLQRLRARRPALFQGLRIVYDAEALFAARDVRQAAVRGRRLPKAEIRERLRAEMALAGTADRVWAVSDRERAQFLGAGISDVRLVSHGVATRSLAPGIEGRRDLLFIGALASDTPNEDSLLWLAHEVLPRLRDEPGFLPTLTVVGECRSRRLAALASPHIRLTGAVADLAPFYDAARLFVAPTRYAAGIPAKVIEAAGNGLPIVTTPLLARQLGWSDRELMIAGDAAAFAAAIGRLLTDDALWRKLRAGMQARTASAYDPALFAQAVREGLSFDPVFAPSSR